MWANEWTREKQQQEQKDEKTSIANAEQMGTRKALIAMIMYTEMCYAFDQQFFFSILFAHNNPAKHILAFQ